MIDITRPLSTETAAWPGDTPLAIDWTLSIAAGDNVSLSRLTMSPHVGTHADAPAHYRLGAADTSAFDLTSFVGRARVIDVRGCASVSLNLLARQGGLGSARLLVRSLDTVRVEEFTTEFPALESAAARALVERGLKLYGTDAPSVDPVESAAMDAHRALGQAQVPIVENLDLTRAEPGEYDLIALPVRLAGAEAAPLRAVLLPAGTLSGRG